MNEKDSPMSGNGFPSKLCPKNRKEFYLLFKRLFELYNSIPHGDTKREFLAGGDDTGNAMILFKGSQSDAFAVKYFLEDLDNDE